MTSAFDAADLQLDGCTLDAFDALIPPGVNLAQEDAGREWLSGRPIHRSPDDRRDRDRAELARLPAVAGSADAAVHPQAVTGEESGCV